MGPSGHPSFEYLAMGEAYYCRSDKAEVTSNDMKVEVSLPGVIQGRIVLTALF